MYPFLSRERRVPRRPYPLVLSSALSPLSVCIKSSMSLVSRALMSENSSVESTVQRRITVRKATDGNANGCLLFKSHHHVIFILFDTLRRQSGPMGIQGALIHIRHAHSCRRHRDHRLKVAQHPIRTTFRKPFTCQLYRKGSNNDREPSTNSTRYVFGRLVSPSVINKVSSQIFFA